MINVKVYGVKEIKANLDKFWAESQKNLAIKMQEVVQRVYYYAYWYVPVRTGKLMSSLGGMVTRRRVWVEGHVWAKTRYAIYVEMGTSRTPKQAFLWPAVQQNRDFIYNKLGEGIVEAIEATGKYARVGKVITGTM